jgi:phosphoglycerate dehydrogenase-like enzyme
MRILVACALDARALERLSKDHEVESCPHPTAGDLAQRIRGKDALVLRSGVSMTRAILESAPELALIVRAGSGVDHIDLREVHRRGIELVRVPTPGARAAAELTFSLMLALARHLIPMDRMMRKGHWAKHDFEGVLLAGKTLGIVGAGNVGGLVGQLGAALGMRVLGCVGQPRAGIPSKLRRLGIEHATFDQVVGQADFLSLHVPLQDSTRGLVDEAVLARVKPGAFLLNMAHADVVDALALYHALRSGKRLQGAALDVHENEDAACLSPMRHLSNVILTPHVGAMTADTQREIGAEVVRIVEDFVSERCEPAITALGA